LARIVSNSAATCSSVLPPKSKPASYCSVEEGVREAAGLLLVNKSSMFAAGFGAKTGYTLSRVRRSSRGNAAG